MAKKVCMYCGKDLHTGSKTTNPFFGVCAECFSKEMAKNENPAIKKKPDENP